MPKISELTAVATPARTQVLPVVDGAATKKLTVAQALGLATIADVAGLQAALDAKTDDTDLGDLALLDAASIAQVTGLQAALDAKAASADLGDLATLDTVANAQVAAGAAIALSKLAALTASRALVSDASGVVTPSAVTSAELAHVAGVTSGIQAQIDALSGAGATDLEGLSDVDLTAPQSGDFLWHNGTVWVNSPLEAADMTDFAAAADARIAAASLADLGTRSASDLSSGTLPDARFPATLPAISGANLTNLPAGSPSGGDTQVQFNDGGAFGGDAGLTFNKTTDSLTVGGATITASAPVLNLMQTWNASGVTFTGLRLNVTDTASAAASMLIDLQAGGATMFSVTKAGGIKIPAGSSSAPALQIGGLGDIYADGGGNPVIGRNGNASLNIGPYASGVRVASGSRYAFSSSSSNAANYDTSIERAAAGNVRVTGNSAASIGALLAKNPPSTRTGHYTVLAGDSGTTFNNSGATGAVALSLPTPEAGMHYRAVVTAAQTFGFTATGGATIRDGATVSAANGTITSNVIGSVFEVEAVSTTEWVVVTGRGAAPTVT